MIRSFCLVCKQAMPGVSRTRLKTRRHSTVTLGNEEVPVIRFPASRQKEFVKSSNQKKKKGKVIVVPRPGKLLVSTNERSLDMYTNEFPTKFEPPTLASQTWTSNKSPGRYFTIHPTRANPSVDYKDKENTSFEKLNLSPTITDALQRIGVTTPTSIQAKAIPVILDGNNVMLAAETGGGKTLSYLLPVIQKLVEMEDKDFRNNSPAALILTPSKELSNQVFKMTEQLDLPVKAGSLDNFWRQRRKRSIKNTDILVTTPILALAALRQRVLSLENLRFAVVDECDTLLDESFSQFVCGILGRINIQKGISRPLLNEAEVQLILCSATFPQYAEKALEDIISLSDVSSVSTGYMHRISPHVPHKFLRVRPSEKLPSLLAMLQEGGDSDKQTMIFCNRRETVSWLSKELVFHGISADAVHNQMELKDRLSAGYHVKAGKTSVLVCTDLSSRGLDTQKVRHVINYEFPNAASDYIHRSGRVGRVGQNGEGKVTSLISRKYEVPLVMKIEEAARRRERIEGVNANIKSYHSERWKQRHSTLEEDLEKQVD